ncbi:MAG TPA: hypothetical protein VNI55_14675 [Gaiellaceae bacterium]|nr:hypothetical protein [Gaiellaceae bacterium]
MSERMHERFDAGELRVWAENELAITGDDPDYGGEVHVARGILAVVAEHAASAAQLVRIQEAVSRYHLSRESAHQAGRMHPELWGDAKAAERRLLELVGITEQGLAAT